MRISLPVLSLEPIREAVTAHPDLPSSPKNPHVHLLDTDFGPHVLIVNGSRVYGIGTSERAALEAAIGAQDPGAVNDVLARFGIDARPYIDDSPLGTPPVRTLSLAVAQKCNLACTYCYAHGGDFGGLPRNMSTAVAITAVERLFEEACPGERVLLVFLGGEPLINRDVLRAATEHAVELARQRRVQIGFSITTNGTLLTIDDGAFFEQHGFAVTISLDGIGKLHDAQRPFKSMRGSYDRIIGNAAALLAMQQHMQVSARVTVTPRNLRLPETLEALIRLGFHSVGFSPMLSSPAERDQMTRPDLDVMLGQMIECGQEFERQTVSGRRYPFANMVNALSEIHKGTHRPYPCGAGAGYFGVSAEGGLWACHRFVDDESGAMGSLGTGIDRKRQSEWLAQRHVHRQEPCRSCWARYLCGGGCHHEVIHRGRPACDYIRGWLHYCLQAYVRLLDARPGYFSHLA